MLDLETKLRDHFSDETTGLVVDDDHLDALVYGRRRRRIRRQNLTVGTVALAGLAALVLLFVIAPLGGGDPSRPVTIGDDSAGDTLYLVPTDVPEGFEPASSYGPDNSDGTVLNGSNLFFPDTGEWDRVQRWVRFDAAHEHPTGVIDIAWGTGKLAESDDPLQRARDEGEPITLFGSEFFISRSQGTVIGPTTGIGGDAPFVRVDAIVPPEAQQGGTPLPEETLLQVVNSLAAREEGGLLVGRPPEGFELVGEWPGGPATLSDLRGLGYEGPGGKAFEVWIMDDTDRPIGVNYRWSSVRQVEVRGREAVVTPFPAIHPPADLSAAGGQRFVEWVEAAGERVTVAGTGMTDDELLAIAQSLDAVDATTWFGLLGEPVPPTSTTAAPTTTTPPAPSAIEHINGTFDGIKHYRLTEESCEQIHDAEFTFRVSDGSLWDFRHDECATVDGNLWSATGTFTLTAPDGATLTGTSLQEDIQLPTTGEPFDLTITGGTGRFDGASGGCRIDVHLTEIGLGTQHQDGTFTCDFTP